MISSKASNWVDRGESPEPTLKRVLSFYLHLELGPADAVLGEYAGVVRGMAEADSTEVDIAKYLESLEEKHGVTEHEYRERRSLAIALWHVVKAAEVRDRALRLLQEYAERVETMKPRLSTWLAERLLDQDPNAAR
jgi:hypothetical protein